MSAGNPFLVRKALDRIDREERTRSRQLSLLPDPIQEQFVEFHHRNPEVYQALVALAHEWRAAGHDKCSIDMLVHLVRWVYGTRTDTRDGFKINDHFTSRYARLIQANERDLAGMFATRALRGDDL